MNFAPLLPIFFLIGFYIGNHTGGVTGGAVQSAIKNCEAHEGLKSIGASNFIKSAYPSKNYFATCNDGVIISGEDTTVDNHSK